MINLEKIRKMRGLDKNLKREQPRKGGLTMDKGVQTIWTMSSKERKT